MKKLLTLLFSMALLVSYAQERQAGPDKTNLPPGNRACTSFVMNDLSGTLTPTDLVVEILAPGMTYQNVVYTGEDVAAGEFTGGVAAGITIESGIMLGSGSLNNAIGPNNEENVSRNNGNPGDTDLDGLIPGYSTHDAAVLEFQFNPGAYSQIYIQFVFGSDEYTEYVGSSYNDVFGFFLNGTNIALVPATTTPVSVNTINPGSNPALYIDNDPKEWFEFLQPDPPYCTEMDGFTVVMAATGTITPNDWNTIKLAIADAGDFVWDSWVAIKTQGFTPIEEEHSDLGILKTVSPPPYYFGDDVVYTLTLTNYGPDDATGVEITDLLQAGYTLVTAVPSQGTYTAGTGVWNVGNLANGASVVLTITATILDNGGPWHNIAAVTAADQDDPTITNNTSSVVIAPEMSPETPIANWALYLGLGLIAAFIVIRFSKVL